MKRYLIIIFLKLLIYLAIFFAFYHFFEKFILIPAILTIIFFVSLDKVLHEFLFNHISNVFFPRISHIEKTLIEFNRKINGITDYRLLLEEFNSLFNQIFSSPEWALYIFENGSFVMTKSQKLKSKVPLEIEWKFIDELKIFYDLRDQENSLKLNNKYIQTILDQNLNLLIPITGKNQVIALLFTNIQNKYLFRDPNINDLSIRIFQKAGNFLENTALYLDVLHRNLEIKKLFEVSQKLLSTLNTNEILDFILESLKEVIPYDASVIFLLDSKNKKLLQKSSYGYGEKTSDLSLKIGQGACGWVAEHKTISIIDEVRNAENYYPLRKETNSQVALPLIIHDEILGVICLEKNESDYFTNNVIEILKIFASQAAIAIHNAKQHEISMAKKSLEYDLINAGNVQKVLLPKRAPNYKNLDIAFINLPSKIVSGDLYDLIPLDSNHLGVIIGDISGKGAAAAIMMSLLLAGFRAFKKTHFTVCETVARLNNLLQESVSSFRYATFFYGLIDLEKEVITYTNAGHNPPLILKKNGNIEKLTNGGIVLGYLANETYKQEKVSFHKGDLLVMYTDGITEAMNDKMDEFGEQRLIDVIRKNSSENSYDLKLKIIDALKNFTDSNEPEDDATLVIIKHA